MPLPISGVGHAIQEDNVSVEFNIPPADSAKVFVAHLNFVLAHLEAKVATMNLKFAPVAAASFPEDQLQSEAAQVFGCEPDWNAWTGETNPRPFSMDMNLRSCGGHVHVGTNLDKIAVVRAMDLHLGVPSVRLDTDKLRRELYGKAGAHRPKAYGVEYRSLSNFWLWSDALKNWVYNQTQKALEFVEAGKEIDKQHGELIQRAINTGDMEAGYYLEKHFFGGLVNA